MQDVCVEVSVCLAVRLCLGVYDIFWRIMEFLWVYSRFISTGSMICPGYCPYPGGMRYMPAGINGSGKLFCLQIYQGWDMLQGQGAEGVCRNGGIDFLRQGVSTACCLFQFRRHAGCADGGRGEVWGTVPYRRN